MSKELDTETVEISKLEFEQFQILKKIYVHSNPERFQGVYFLCGESGKKDEMGLPERIIVCPAMGLEGIAVYSLTQPYTEPSW